MIDLNLFINVDFLVDVGFESALFLDSVELSLVRGLVLLVSVLVLIHFTEQVQTPISVASLLNSGSLVVESNRSEGVVLAGLGVILFLFALQPLGVLLSLRHKQDLY